MDKQHYDFLIVSERERAAYDSAYKSALHISHCKLVAQRAAERAVFIEAAQMRRERETAQMAS